MKSIFPVATEHQRRPMKTLAAMAVLATLVTWNICQAGEPLPEQLRTCVSLRRDAERLACYDRAVALIQSGNAASPAPSPENMFGASASTQPAPVSKKDEE